MIDPDLALMIMRREVEHAKKYGVSPEEFLKDPKKYRISEENYLKFRNAKIELDKPKGSFPHTAGKQKKES